MDNNIRNVRIGDVLKEYGYVTEEQIDAALAYQKEHKGVRLGAALTDMGFISEEQLLEALSTLLQARIIDISTIEVDVEAVQKIPRQLAEKYDMLAYSALDSANGAQKYEKIWKSGADALESMDDYGSSCGSGIIRPAGNVISAGNAASVMVFGKNCVVCVDQHGTASNEKTQGSRKEAF